MENEFESFELVGKKELQKKSSNTNKKLNLLLSNILKFKDMTPETLAKSVESVKHLASMGTDNLMEVYKLLQESIKTNSKTNSEINALFDKKFDIIKEHALKDNLPDELFRKDISEINSDLDKILEQKKLDKEFILNIISKGVNVFLLLFLVTAALLSGGKININPTKLLKLGKRH